MLYHFSNVYLLDILTTYLPVFNSEDIIVLSGSTLRKIKDIENESLIKSLILVSKNIGFAAIFPACSMGDEENSIIIIDKGKFIGISKPYSKKIKSKNNDINIYEIKGKTYFLILNEDIFIKETLIYIKLLNPDYIIHLDQLNHSNKKSLIAAALSVNNTKKVYSLFNDASIFYDRQGSIKQIEIGHFRRMQYFKSS